MATDEGTATIAQFLRSARNHSDRRQEGHDDCDRWVDKRQEVLQIVSARLCVKHIEFSQLNVAHVCVNSRRSVRIGSSLLIL